MDALCLRYEHMMWAEPDFEGEFGDLATFGSLDERRAQFRSYIEGMAAEMRAGADDEAERAERDAATVEKVMRAWERTHGTFTYEGIQFDTQTIDMGNPHVAAEMQEEKRRRKQE